LLPAQHLLREAVTPHSPNGNIGETGPLNAMMSRVCGTCQSGTIDPGRLREDLKERHPHSLPRLTKRLFVKHLKSSWPVVALEEKFCRIRNSVRATDVTRQAIGSQPVHQGRSSKVRIDEDLMFANDSRNTAQVHVCPVTTTALSKPFDHVIHLVSFHVLKLNVPASVSRVTMIVDPVRKVAPP
jgi:hypothetical protein